MLSARGMEAGLRERLRLFPGDVDALYLLALLRTHSSLDYTGAEEMYQAVLARNPSHVGALVNYASLKYSAFNEYADAEELCRRALGADPDNAAARSHLDVLRTLRLASGDLLASQSSSAQQQYSQPNRAAEIQTPSAARVRTPREPTASALPARSRMTPSSAVVSAGVGALASNQKQPTQASPLMPHHAASMTVGRASAAAAPQIRPAHRPLDDVMDDDGDDGDDDDDNHGGWGRSTPRRSGAVAGYRTPLRTPGFGHAPRTPGFGHAVEGMGTMEAMQQSPVHASPAAGAALASHVQMTDGNDGVRVEEAEGSWMGTTPRTPKAERARPAHDQGHLLVGAGGETDARVAPGSVDRDGDGDDFGAGEVIAGASALFRTDVDPGDMPEDCPEGDEAMCMHKSWKVRQYGYSLISKRIGIKGAVNGDVALAVSAVSDGNVNNQDKGLDFAAALSGAASQDDVSMLAQGCADALVHKCLPNARNARKAQGLAVLLCARGGVPAASAVVGALIPGMSHKVAKVAGLVVESLTAIVQVAPTPNQSLPNQASTQSP